MNIDILMTIRQQACYKPHSALSSVDVLDGGLGAGVVVVPLPPEAGAAHAVVAVAVLRLGRAVAVVLACNQYLQCFTCI